jgi:hypothetical protein
MADKKPFAYYEGEDPEQTAAYIAGLETDLRGRRARGEDEASVLAELKRMGVATKTERAATKQTRPGGAGVEKRA